MPTIPKALAALPFDVRAKIIRSLPAPYIRRLNAHFPEWHHPGQLPPPGDWRNWVIMAGRGFGKTRAGAEWVMGCVRGSSGTVPLGTVPCLAKGGQSLKGQSPLLRIALVAATLDEARRIMVEGPSGLLAVARSGEIARWSPAERTLTFANGAEAVIFSGASPQSLRGPEHDFAWCDELAKWKHPKHSWDMLQLGLRRGRHPQALITTTPQAGPVLQAILDAPDTVQSGGHTRDNPHNAASFVAAVEGLYAGTRLGVQELEGRLLADVEGSLWPLALIEAARVTPPLPGASHLSQLAGWLAPGNPPSGAPEGERVFVRTVIGVDPPASASGTCGILVCGLGEDGHAYVIADASVSGRSPEGWAQAVARAAAMHGADRIIVEKNQGGDMVEAVLRGACPSLPLTPAHAKDSKAKRAEPVAALFERGEAFFAGSFPELEAQLGGLVPGGGYQGPGHSPDRADAMVWAMTALMLRPKRAEPHIRML